MPLPIIHSVAGYSVSRFSGKELKRSWKTALFCIVLANLPDIDFVPGLMAGEAIRFHHGFMHSPAAAVLIGLAAGAVFFLIRKTGFLKFFSLTFFSYGSHILLDYCNGGEGGVPLLWPFSSEQFHASFSISGGRGILLEKGEGFSAFMNKIFSLESWRLMAFELITVMMFFLVLKLITEFGRRLQLKPAAVMAGCIMIFVYFLF